VAFQPIRRPALPIGNRQLTIGNPIDAFIRGELHAKGLKPNPPATKLELIRRAFFDLIGLPPTPEQITAFEKDKSPDAWPRLIDRLLSLPQYGERWAGTGSMSRASPRATATSATAKSPRPGAIVITW